MGRCVFLVLMLLLAFVAFPVHSRRQRAVPKRYASASGKEQKPKVKKSLIDADKRATAVGSPKGDGKVDKVAVEVDAAGDVKQDAIDGSEEGGDVDIEGAVRRALELTPNATETLEAKRFFEDIVESQRKQEETMKRMLEEMRRMRSEIERLVEQ